MRSFALPVLLCLASACAPKPTQEEIDQGKQTIQAAVEAANVVRTALELLGLLPNYECGEPRRSFVGKAVAQARADYPCVSARTEALNDTHDAVVLTFPEDGCAIPQGALSGTTVFSYSGGEDRFSLEADFNQLKVNGQAIPALAGYGKCGDEEQYWGKGEGAVPKKPDYRFKLDEKVAKREGLPIIGGTTLIATGPGELSHPQGVDRVTLTELEYELKEFLPKNGRIFVETSSGTTVQATFRNKLWRFGEAELVIDDKAPVTVPIFH